MTLCGRGHGEQRAQSQRVHFKVKDKRSRREGVRPVFLLFLFCFFEGDRHKLAHQVMWSWRWVPFKSSLIFNAAVSTIPFRVAHQACFVLVVPSGKQKHQNKWARCLFSGHLDRIKVFKDRTGLLSGGLGTFRPTGSAGMVFAVLLFTRVMRTAAMWLQKWNWFRNDVRGTQYLSWIATVCVCVCKGLPGNWILCHLQGIVSSLWSGLIFPQPLLLNFVTLAPRKPCT